MAQSLPAYNKDSTIRMIRANLRPAKLMHYRAGSYERDFWRDACPEVVRVDWKMNFNTPGIWPGVEYGDLEPIFGDLRENLRTTRKGIEIIPDRDVMKISKLYCDIYGLSKIEGNDVILQTNHVGGVIQKPISFYTEPFNYESFEEPLKHLKVGLNREDAIFALGLPNDENPDLSQLTPGKIILNNYYLIQGQSQRPRTFNLNRPRSSQSSPVIA